MALQVGGVDVATLSVESFATPAERDAFILGLLHGLDAAIDILSRSADGLRAVGAAGEAAVLTRAAEALGDIAARRHPAGGAL